MHACVRGSVFLPAVCTMCLRVRVCMLATGVSLCVYARSFSPVARSGREDLKNRTRHRFVRLDIAVA